MSKETKLKQIEDRLSIYLSSSDRRNWADTFKLMKRVRDEELYSNDYASLTQWVNALADRNYYHQSTLWNRFNAGNTYAEYAERKKKAGQEVKSIEQVDISPDTIALVGTIANRSKDTKYADDLMDKAWEHDLSRQDLRDINRQIRAEHSRVKQDIDEQLDDVKVNNNKINVTADMMVKAFQSDTSWLDADHRHRKNDFYKVFPELPVHSGTSIHARRMDVCILENLTDEHALSSHVNIHCVENKVSKNDLVRDHKMGEYADYGDFFWLCIPKELLEVAEKYVAQGWGILIVNDNENIHAARKAAKRECIFRQETLTEAVTHSN